MNFGIMLKKQKKITQYDYERESKPFEKYVIKADEKMDADYAVIHLDGVGVTKNFFNKMTEENQSSVIFYMVDKRERVWYNNSIKCLWFK